MQKQKTVLITGGNDGIGKATANELAQRGFQVLLACRNETKGRLAAEDIRRQTGNERVTFLPCDLASFESIRDAARLFQAQNSQLDVLINNAGVYTSQLAQTEDGIEMQFGVNHLGHFLLTHLLLGPLRQAPEPRVINVSSVAYLRGRIDFNNLRGEKGPGQYDGLQAYARSKLANVLFTRELARRYPEIHSFALHPGAVRTQIGNKHSKWYTSLFWHLLKVLMVTPDKGAGTSVYLATSPEVKDASGLFFDDKQRRRELSEAGRSDALARQLWEVCERMVNINS
ncbi:MAG: SDR family oxidoreductase [Lewinellaceae bacterium]|nr:SDR family oxidoreductase [Phaeodactylibacter sp.]MCB9346741.1 SDR family oxidoreductase [Lewinellaceae bacterium]